MKVIKISNRIIKKPLLEIIYDLRRQLSNGKLQTVKDRGDNIRVTCPFHKGGLENKASADVYIGDDNRTPYGWFKCFTCNEQGPFEKFVAGCFECSIVDAQRWLIENYAEEIDDDSLLDLPEIDLNPKKSINYLPEKTLNSFESFHPYMIERKLSKKIINAFEVKYDPKTQSLVFPVRDELGRLVMLTRRSVINKTFIIDKDKEKPLYLLYYVKQHNIEHAMITEGQIDALTACTYGFPCMATMGAVSDHQIDLLNKSGIRVLYIMFDNDVAGYRFTQKVLSRLSKSILPVVVKIPFSDKKDINDLSEAEFKYCINQAQRNY